MITSPNSVEAIHATRQHHLPLDDVRVCYHDDADLCTCRKPAPGLLFDAAQEAGVDLAASFLVGDRWRDIEAGQRAGCTTLFLDYHYAEPRPPQPYICVASLADAADWTLAHTVRSNP